MKRKMYKVIALLMALAVMVGLALSEETLEMPDGEPVHELQQGDSGLEIDGEAAPDVESTDEIPADLDSVDLTLGSLDPVSEVTYRFIVEGVEYAVQNAQAGEAILRLLQQPLQNARVWLRGDPAVHAQP